MGTTLQWVHGRITVVMLEKKLQKALHELLQWVHGRITVVMNGQEGEDCQGAEASMGPRSDNRGYALTHPSSVGMTRSRFNGSTVG